jgi:hypothetical protein
MDTHVGATSHLEVPTKALDVSVVMAGCVLPPTWFRTLHHPDDPVRSGAHTILDDCAPMQRTVRPG